MASARLARSLPGASGEQVSSPTSQALRQGPGHKVDRTGQDTRWTGEDRTQGGQDRPGHKVERTGQDTRWTGEDRTDGRTVKMGTD